MEKWREKISRWKFDRKMQALITIALMITTLIFFVMSTVSSGQISND